VTSYDSALITGNSEVIPGNSDLPLALIGNASGPTFARRGISIRGVFDKEVRRKPLAFAADAWSHEI